MKYAIMSDAHSNPQALEAALADARRLGCGKYVFLGDVTGYGYDVKSTLRLVREHFDVALMGNHDSACLGQEPLHEVMMNPNYDIDRAQRDELTEEEVDWLRGRDYIHRIRSAAFVHGDFCDPKGWAYVFSTEDAVRNLFARNERLLFCGHTHHAAIWEQTAKGTFRGRFVKRLMRPATETESVTVKLAEGNRFVVNVGSVGYPRNDLCCSYGIYDGASGSVTIRRLPFDFSAYIKNMLACRIDLPSWLYELLMMAQNQQKGK